MVLPNYNDEGTPDYLSSVGPAVKCETPRAARPRSRRSRHDDTSRSSVKWLDSTHVSRTGRAGALSGRRHDVLVQVKHVLVIAGSEVHSRRPRRRKCQRHELRREVAAGDRNDDVLVALVEEGHGRRVRLGRQLDP